MTTSTRNEICNETPPWTVERHAIERPGRATRQGGQAPAPKRGTPIPRRKQPAAA